MYDHQFVEFLNKITYVTVVDPHRCYTLWQLAKHGKSIAGNVAEVGVFKGGTLYILSRVFEKKVDIFGFDTFSGMPDSIIPDVDDHRAGDFKGTTEREVRNFIGKDFYNVKLIKGTFPNSAGSDFDKKKFSFVHIDCDIYQSVFDSCRFFYEKMKKGGIMLFDDYGFESCRGAKKAIDDFFSDQMESVIYMITGQAMVVKL
jgi:O-methyltransferase